MERRDFFTITGGLAGAALLASCTRDPAGTPASPVRAQASGTPAPAAHVLYADVSTNLSAIDAGTGATIYSSARPVPAADWSRLYTVSPAGRLLTLDARTGRELSRTPVPPGLVARAVSPLGTSVVLGAPAQADPYGKPGRRITTLVVADPRESTAPQVLRLDGNFEPDGFSSDGSVLFLLQYLPATAPEGYRVKAYSVGQRKFLSLLTRDKTPVPKGAEETMRGEGRIAVMDTSGRRLYTLYTHQPDHLHTRDLVAGRTTGVHAFVHVLDLTQQWAYCLDLPEPFGRGPAENHTLAISYDSLYIYDGTTGTLAQAATESLAIERTVSIGASSGTAWASAAGDSLYIAAGPSVRAVGTGALTIRGAWRLPAAALGVAISPDEKSVYAGISGGVVRLDGQGGRELSRLAVPGISRLRHVASSPTG
ncbi:hypothetical protein GCM10022226_17140 [Sphaerisporangium flaviroseum]|uniref:Uncharacterized protein n=1 Tax=Sphaerisporangium flaviroseum TaxID=509199 RepID=A0ABP7HP27_9ACTN